MNFLPIKDFLPQTPNFFWTFTFSSDNNSNGTLYFFLKLKKITQNLTTANKYNNVDDISNKISKMLEGGLDILDIGGYSSRPGAKNISSDEEKSRVLPVLKHIKKKFKSIMEYLPNTRFWKTV